MVSLPAIIWADILRNIHSAIDYVHLGMTCKKFHKEVMEEGLKWRQAEQESRRWYAGGLQSFRLRGESHLDVCRRLEKATNEMKDMIMRYQLGTTTTTLGKKGDDISYKIMECFQAYEVWKQITPNMRDEDSNTRNEESFRFYSEKKEEIRLHAKAAWGCYVSESIFNYLMFHRANNKFGFENFVEKYQGGWPYGFLQWLLKDPKKRSNKQIHSKLGNGEDANYIRVISGFASGTKILKSNSPNLPGYIWDKELGASTLLGHYAGIIIKAFSWCIEEALPSELYMAVVPNDFFDGCNNNDYCDGEDSNEKEDDEKLTKDELQKELYHQLVFLRMELQSKFYQSASFTKQNDILSNESLLSLSNNMPSLFIYMETIIGFPKANLYGNIVFNTINEFMKKHGIEHDETGALIFSNSTSTSEGRCKWKRRRLLPIPRDLKRFEDCFPLLYLLEQLLKFENVLGVASFGPHIYIGQK